MDLDLSAFTYEFEKDLNYEGIEMSDTSKVTFWYNDDMCGYIYFTEYLDLSKFNDFFDSKDLKRKFIWDKFLFIEEFYVTMKFRYKGIGNYMLSKLFSEIIPIYFHHYDIVGLFAEPFEMNINLISLKAFYKKYGFKILNVKQCTDPDYPQEEFPPNNYMFKILK